VKPKIVQIEDNTKNSLFLLLPIFGEARDNYFSSSLQTFLLQKESGAII